MLNTGNLVEKRKSLAEMFALSNPNRTPILSNLRNMGMESVSNTVHAWVDYQVENTKATVTADALIGATSIVVDNGKFVEVGKYIVIGNEVLKVTGIVTNTLTVERAKLGTSAAAITTGALAFLVSDGKAEGSEWVDGQTKDGANYLNYTQIFTTPLSVSGTAEAITAESADGRSLWDIEMERKQIEHEAKIEKAIMQGVPSVSGTTRWTGGIRHFLNSGSVLAVGGDFTYDKLVELLRALYEKGAPLDNGTYAIIVPPIQKNKISNFLKNYIQTERTDEVLGQVANYLVTDFGLMPMIMSNNLSNSEIFVVDLDTIKIKPLVGKTNRTLVFEEMGTTGDNTKAQYLSELTLEIRNIHLQGKLTGLTV